MAELFLVVINEEEQYSISPAGKAVPAGWFVVGEPRTQEQALQYIESVWTDITPRSARGRAVAE